MCVCMKMALAAGTAAGAVVACYKERYHVALSRFRRAERWWPGIIESEALYSAYYALALIRTGEEDEGFARLKPVRDRVAAESDLQRLLNEVDSVLAWG